MRPLPSRSRKPVLFVTELLQSLGDGHANERQPRRNRSQQSKIDLPSRTASAWQAIRDPRDTPSTPLRAGFHHAQPSARPSPEPQTVFRNGATGTSDMARMAARAAVERSGSCRDTTPVSVIHNLHALFFARVIREHA